MQDPTNLKWPMRTDDLAELLGMANDYIRSIKNTWGPKQGIEFLPEIDFIQGGGRKMTLWTIEGAKKIAKLTKSQKAKEFLEWFGEKPQNYKPEDYVLNTLIHAINGHTEYFKNFPVNDYRIDLYLPQLRIAIEVDEKDHAGYKDINEIERENRIIKTLQCRFQRLNSHDYNINIKIGNIINNIFSMIYKSINVSTDLDKLEKWSPEVKKEIIRKQNKYLKMLKELEEEDL